VPLVPIQVPVPQYHDQRPSKKGEPEVMQLFLQQPTVLKLSLESTLKIPDQKTQLVYVGRKTKEVRMESNVPLLSRVPYVSRLFRNVGYGSETQLLVVFLTPRVSAGAGGLATD
jgi:type II/III secretion system protein